MLRARYSNTDKFPSSAGIDPVSVFWSRLSSSNTDKLPSSAGIDPVSALYERSNTIRFDKLSPIDLGIGPTSSLFSTNMRFSRLVKFSNASPGSFPFRSKLVRFMLMMETLEAEHSRPSQGLGIQGSESEKFQCPSVASLYVQYSPAVAS